MKGKCRGAHGRNKRVAIKDLNNCCICIFNFLIDLQSKQTYTGIIQLGVSSN